MRRWTSTDVSPAANTAAGTAATAAAAVAVVVIVIVVLLALALKLRERGPPLIAGRSLQQLRCLLQALQLLKTTVDICQPQILSGIMALLCKVSLVPALAARVVLSKDKRLDRFEIPRSEGSRRGKLPTAHLVETVKKHPVRCLCLLPCVKVTIIGIHRRVNSLDTAVHLHPLRARPLTLSMLRNATRDILRFADVEESILVAFDNVHAPAGCAWRR